VLLHASPAVDIYGGIKLAAGGELGVGVGEEEWGSGEREVLEGLARNTDGLIDAMVSRFGEPETYDASDVRTTSSKTQTPEQRKEPEPWLGSGRYAGPADGLLFSGIGAVTCDSLLSLSEWTQSIYAYGEDAYGIRDNPSSGRRKRRKGNPPDSDLESLKPQLSTSMSVVDHEREAAVSLEIDSNEGHPLPDQRTPLPIVSSTPETLNKANHLATNAQKTAEKQDPESKYFLADPEIWMKYLTLGYGSNWGGYGRAPNPTHTVSGPTQQPNSVVDLQSKARRTSTKNSVAQTKEEEESKLGKFNATEDKPYSSGNFIIGLEGDMEELSQLDIDADPEDGDWNSRISLRTLYIQTTTPRKTATEEDDDGRTITEDFDGSSSFGQKSGEVTKFKRIQVIVYVVCPMHS